MQVIETIQFSGQTYILESVQYLFASFQPGQRTFLPSQAVLVFKSVYHLVTIMMTPLLFWILQYYLIK